MTRTQSAIGVGIIGSGVMAGAYAECLQKYVAVARLVVVGGGLRARTLAKKYGVSAVESAGLVFSHPEVAAVIVATPESSHAPYAIAAAAAGRHVLVEKPMAPDVAACDGMIAACAQAGVELMVVKHWRYRGVHRRALDVLRDGRHGQIVHVRNQTRVALASSLATVAQKPFYLDPTAGGLLMGWAVHNLDWVCHLVGSEPVDVRALAPARAHPVLGGTNMAVEIQFAAGAVAEVVVEIDCSDAPALDQVFRTGVTTSTGRLDLDGYGMLREQITDEPWRVVWTQPHFDPRDATDPNRLAAYAAMVQAFIDAIHSGNPAPISGRDGRRAVRLFRAALEAHRTNQTVPVSEREP